MWQAAKFAGPGILALGSPGKFRTLLAHQPHGNLHMRLPGGLERRDVKLGERQAHHLTRAPKRVAAAGAGDFRDQRDR